MIESRCATPANVAVRIVGSDANGDPVVVHETWPFSTRAIGPGKHPASLDYAITWAPGMDDLKWSIAVISADSP